MRASSNKWFAVALGLCAAMASTTEAPLAIAQNPTQSASSAPAPVPLPDYAPKPPFRRMTGPETLNPGDYPAGFPYPDEYDSAVAASEVHHVRYVDAHVRLVEVAYFPGVHGQMHGHPFPSVFAVDSPVPKGYNLMLDPERKPLVGRGNAPKGMEYPICRTMNPQSPHAETNLDTWPHHFYRLEFLRVDGKGIQDHWKEWYPRLSDPLFAVQSLKRSKADSKFSAAWPYSLDFDSVRAAPQNYQLLYEDDHIRLVEVIIRPGETEAMEGNPYPSVTATDAISGSTMEDVPLDASHKLDSANDGHAPAPPGFESPICSTKAPQAPHALHNTGTAPEHFYRIDFKRIDGDDLKTRWREWYPWMGKLTDEYKTHPYVSNYY